MNLRTAALSGASLAVMAGSLVGLSYTAAGAHTVTPAARTKKCNVPGLNACAQWTNSASNGIGVTGIGGTFSGFGILPITGGGLLGLTTNGTTGVQGAAIGGGTALSAAADQHSVALSAYRDSSAAGDLIAEFINGENNAVFQATATGNVTIAGEIFTAGPCSTGCAHKRVVSYAQRTTMPTIEDVGEATLRGGEAFVPLDRSLLNAMDSGKSYIVTLTPEADVSGLYVASRTARGFEVRETHGGRSNAPFAYRLVAHPYGAAGPRLPLMDVRAHR